MTEIKKQNLTTKFFVAYSSMETFGDFSLTSCFYASIEFYASNFRRQKYTSCVWGLEFIDARNLQGSKRTWQRASFFVLQLNLVAFNAAEQVSKNV